MVLGVGLLIAVVSMPWWASQEISATSSQLCCYIAVAQMWNLLAGYGGLVSVGQQTFIGVAAYTMFVMAQLWGINPFLAVLLCLVAPAILAVPTYALLHRLDGPYFAIGTWVVAEVYPAGHLGLPLCECRRGHEPARHDRAIRPTSGPSASRSSARCCCSSRSAAVIGFCGRATGSR